MYATPKLRCARVISAFSWALIGFYATACGGGGGAGPTVTESPATATPVPALVPGRIAFVDLAGNAVLINSDGTGRAAVTETGDVKRLAWSPDGSLLAVTREGDEGPSVQVVGVDGVVRFEVAAAAGPSWSPAGDRLAIVTGPNVAVYDSSGALVREVAEATQPAWSPGGTLLAFQRTSADRRKGIPVVMDVASGVETPLDPDLQPDDVTYPIAWHPGGDVVASRNVLYDLASGVTEEVDGTAVSWSPDGRTLMVIQAFSAPDDAWPGWLLDMTQDRKAVIGFYVRPAAESNIAWSIIQRWTDWSPDGRFLLYLDPEPGRERARLYDTVNPDQNIYPKIAGEWPSIAPDGANAVFAYQEHVWVLALDGTALSWIAEGTFAAWQQAGF